MPRPATHLPPVQAIVKMVNAPQIVIARALCARGNLGKALTLIAHAIVGERHAAPVREAAKGFNWIVRGCYLCALIRGLQNLEASLKRF